MSIDWSILHWVRDVLTCPFLDFLMPKLTLLSNGGAVWLLAAGGLLCTKKYRWQGLLLLGGLAVGVLVGNVCLKNLIARPRPCWGWTAACSCSSLPPQTIRSHRVIPCPRSSARRF